MRHAISRVVSLALGAAAAAAIALVPVAAADENEGWPQWGQNPRHQGFVDTEGQPAAAILADVVYDPFTKAEEDSTGGDLLVHYQVPLLEGNDVYMEFKTGQFTGNNTWNTQIWNQRKLSWQGGQLVQQWNFQTDWKPVPHRITTANLWEPVYHAVLANGFVYDPGFGGTIFKLDKNTGAPLERINPFATIDPNTFVAGPLTADRNGNIYYNVWKMDRAVALPPARAAFVDSWLVKVTSGGTVTKVRYSELLASANPPTTCVTSFEGRVDLPWPPSPSSVPPSAACGPQRVGLNIAPAVAPDGTIYTATRAELNTRYSYLVAVNPNLTLKWAASLRDRGLNDGCGVLVPKATAANPVQKGKCSFDAPTGVDPATNQMPAGRVNDSGTASPTVLPDGSVLYGSYTRYNIARGHLFKFSSSGQFQAFFDFGWDDTLAVVPREDDRFSIVMKDNHYDEEGGFYCNPDPTFPKSLIVCASTGIPAGPFYITQVDQNLVPEWKFQSTETRKCKRNPDGSVTCVDDGTQPNGFEWCINAPAVDGEGNVYVLSEDGFLYVLDQGHSGVFTTPKAKFFLNLAIGAAYTPFSIDSEGRLYAQNNGHLFVLGQGDRDVDHADDHDGQRTKKRLDPESGDD